MFAWRSHAYRRGQSNRENPCKSTPPTDSNRRPLLTMETRESAQVPRCAQLPAKCTLASKTEGHVATRVLGIVSVERQSFPLRQPKNHARPSARPRNCGRKQHRVPARMTIQSSTHKAPPQRRLTSIDPARFTDEHVDQAVRLSCRSAARRAVPEIVTRPVCYAARHRSEGVP
jgi:hypothetical protein